MAFRVGFGTDIHLLVSERPLVLGSCMIPSAKGCIGHSDADVLLHALTDALLGALALGDIGTHFPDTESRWKDAESRMFVGHALSLIHGRGFSVVNLDAVIHLEEPRLSPHIPHIRKAVAEILQIPVEDVSIKAKTAEKMGSVGRAEAIEAQVVVLLKDERVSKEA